MAAILLLLAGRRRAPQALAKALRQEGLQVIDLRDDLNGVRGTYRLTDGHWTKLGTEIIARQSRPSCLSPAGKPIESGKRDGE